MTKFLTAALLAGAALMAVPAQAGFLGKTVDATYYYPNTASPYESHSVVVGSSVEVPNFIGYFSLDLGDHQFVATANGNSTAWAGADFSGWVVSDTTNNVAAIIGVSIDAATTMVIDSSRITFDADHVYVNWQGLAYTSGTVLALDVVTADDVPEPAMLGLFGLGAIGLGLSRRRKAA